ncbi:hypothetical protein [uncultured Shewanella sp.]|uniref:hypothetical protein n=1 Tax=uncultured Shewanella sp. TaxID=173975 RepID=UPI0026154506|nr:hypothetical protein [uncultured Shewanella sp.]
MENHLIILAILIGSCSITLSLFYYSQTKSALWLTIFGFFACATLFNILSVIFPDTYWLAHFTFVFIPILCLFYCRHYPNWLYFLSIPMGGKIIYIILINKNLLTIPPSWIFYCTGIGLELLVIFLIFYRGILAQTLGLNVYYRRIPQEYLLMSLYCVGVIINIIALVEDIIRNNHILGDFFVPYQPMFFYNIYLVMRLPLNLAELILYVVMAYFAARSSRPKPISSAVI